MKFENQLRKKNQILRRYISIFSMNNIQILLTLYIPFDLNFYIFTYFINKYYIIIFYEQYLNLI